MKAGQHLKGDAGSDDEGPLHHPLLKHQLVAAVTRAHAQPARAGLRILVGRQQVDVVRFEVGILLGPLGDGATLCWSAAL